MKIKKKNRSTFFKVKNLLIFLSCCFLPVMAGYADGGYVPYAPVMVVSEPSQSALIGWNGTVEVMVLSTNVRANASGWVIELIPFPSLLQPEDIQQGSLESLQQISNYIDKQLNVGWMGDVNLDGMINIVDALQIALYTAGIKPGGFYKYAADYSLDGSISIVDAFLVARKAAALDPNTSPVDRSNEIKVAFQQQIGVHNLTVVEATDAAALIHHAEQLLAEKVPAADVAWEDFKSIIDDYLERGISCWVIDLLELGSLEKSREPLIYRFASSCLYFPLKVSSLNAGQTVIEVYTVTCNALDKAMIEETGFEGLPIDTFYDISRSELQAISPAIDSLFDSSIDLLKTAKLQYVGLLEDLAKDLMVIEHTP